VTQILGGLAADRLGGARVLLVGLGLWSLAVTAIPAASAMSSSPVAMLVAARVMFGAASGCAIPASAAAVASYVPSERRSSSLSLIFTFFNCGSAFGLLLAGGLISTLGWQSVFLAFGGVGVAWSIFGYAALPEAAKTVRVKAGGGGGGGGEGEGAVRGGGGSADGGGGAGGGWGTLPRWMYPQLAALAWCHVCVNWGFFILQSWLPVYLSKAGVALTPGCHSICYMGHTGCHQLSRVLTATMF
jgi:ACS family sodium-dependent inorganic phosphate cotransporter